jgi:N-acetylglutamate synthase-like GNAT family acetyltransferase
MRYYPGVLKQSLHQAKNIMTNLNIELHDNSLIHTGLESVTDFYQTLSSHSKQFQDATACITGMNSIFFNGLFDNRINKNESKELSQLAEQYFNQYQVPWAWFITPPSQNDLPELGYKLVEEAPAMYFDLTQPFREPETNSINIREVDCNSDFSEWIIPINDGFQVKEGDDSYLILNVNVMKKHANKFHHYTAYKNGVIAGASTLFLTRNAVMLHNIATLTNYRKCGVGTALTLHMMKEAKKKGYKHCFLDSSEVAFNLYRKIGFKVYTSTLVYSKSY